MGIPSVILKLAIKYGGKVIRWFRDGLAVNEILRRLGLN